MKLIRVAVLCVFIAACGGSEPGHVKSAESRSTRVLVGLPVQRDIDEVLTALGSVESINDPTVSAETSGQVQQIAVREGSEVESGQLLAALDSTLHAIDSAKAAAELRRYDVLVENQDSEVQRLKRLDESRSVSRDKLEDELAQLDMLQAQREVARKQWEQYKFLESKTRIIAPLGGVVTQRHISPGDYVSTGQPLFELVSVERLRARIAFPESDASRVAVGKQVLLTTPTAPGTPAVGTVTAVNPQVRKHNRAVEIIVEFDNPGGWLPGASVDATLIVERRAGALTVPPLAIVNRDGRDVVFVVEDNSASALPIITGWRESDWVEILDGITPADQVVVEGAGLLSDGSPVVVEKPAP